MNNCSKVLIIAILLLLCLPSNNLGSATLIIDLNLSQYSSSPTHIPAAFILFLITSNHLIFYFLFSLFLLTIIFKTILTYSVFSLLIKCPNQGTLFFQSIFSVYNLSFFFTFDAHSSFICVPYSIFSHHSIRPSKNYHFHNTHPLFNSTVNHPKFRNIFRFESDLYITCINIV